MLSPDQLAVINSPEKSSLFLRGPAGTGKTTCGVERIHFLLNGGIPAESILVLTPQRTLQEAYLNAGKASWGQVAFATIGGLARRMVDLFWPLAIEIARFKDPDQPPTFLTLETAQYHMSQNVRPRLEGGWFNSVVMDRNRLYSQILDNLNKSAAVGFAHTDIGNRLASAWGGDPAQRRVFADAQSCAIDFRHYCLDHNLLDFSLQLEVFSKLYWNEHQLRDYIIRQYRNVVYDNSEEDIPLAHDLMSDLLPDLDSALIIHDDGAGYRRFLGADPESALKLVPLCERTITLYDSFIASENLSGIATKLTAFFSPVKDENLPEISSVEHSIEIIDTRFHPEMLDAVSSEIHALQTDGVPASEIVVLAPYLSDALRFSLTNRLEKHGIATRTHRPSRSLKEEPACQCLLAFAELAHPQWGVKPGKFDIAHAFLQAIEGMDLVRAHLLCDIVYRMKDASLGSFEIINPAMQERITYLLGSRYETLRLWLNSYREEAPQPLDHFLRRLFGEILSQPGFRFHQDLDSARVAASLIESIQKFRMSQSQSKMSMESIGKEYITMLQEGVIAAQYISAWADKAENAILIAPAYTYLMSNRPSTIQFWLDIGSSGWYERLFQPLTHPYVLSRGWEREHIWTDSDEVEANNDTLVRLTTGLIRRCRKKIYLCISELGESGYEQREILLRAFNQVFSQVD